MGSSANTTQFRRRPSRKRKTRAGADHDARPCALNGRSSIWPGYDALRAPDPVVDSRTPAATPTLAILVQEHRDLHVSCNLCDQDYFLGPERVARIYGAASSFADLRGQLKAACRNGGRCQLTAGLRLAPDRRARGQGRP